MILSPSYTTERKKNLVRLHSFVTIRELAGSQILSFRLVNAGPAAPANERLSVHSQFGQALAGLEEGDLFEWVTSPLHVGKYIILSVL
ncbi:Transcription elongation factor, GreA/GreB, C-term [bacterium A37T11]|nr:Transcription elongation factor, GreA/GreB, C-term [bacterium A37T11]